MQHDSHHGRLGKGFNWLGGAMILAKIVDFSTIFAVLLFLTKQQVGVASVVVSIGMIVEAFNGLGTSEALLQARSVSRTQLDTLFWYVMVAAIVAGGLTILAAPLAQSLYGPSENASYFIAVAIKQLCVGAALIPLALLNRDLQYERIAAVNLCATLAAAVTRLSLAAMGAGAWALVAGHAASGFYIFVGAMAARPFRPRLHVTPASIVPLMSFGARAAAANVIEQTFKNTDFLLVGWFYGPSALAVYRIAFDVAMEPAMAVATLVNRTVLPVLARAAATGTELSSILMWAVRRTLTLTAPLMMALILLAGQLTALLHDENGMSYAAAALPLKVLAAAAILRVLGQHLPTVMLVSGQPGLAARLSATIFLLLTMGILAVGVTFQTPAGIDAVAAVWLGVYLPVVAWGVFYLRRVWAIPLKDMLQAITMPLLGITIMGVAAELCRQVAKPGHVSLQIGIICAVLFATYAGLFFNARNRVHEQA